MRIGGKLFLWIAVAAIAGLGPVTTVRADVLGYWPFDDPGDPAVALDSSIEGNDGTITGANYTADGGGRTGLPGDTALEFKGAGSGDTVVIDNATAGALDSISTNNQLTIGFWLFGSDDQPLDQTHFWSEPGRQFSAHIPWSNSNVYFDTSGCCSGAQRINTAIPDNLWKYLVSVPRAAQEESWA